MSEPPKVLPEGHRFCNGCGATGIGSDHFPCEICVGKGFWNAEDIRAFHVRAPHICKASCGETHRDPYIPTLKEQEESARELREAVKSFFEDG